MCCGVVEAATLSKAGAATTSCAPAEAETTSTAGPAVICVAARALTAVLTPASDRGQVTVLNSSENRASRQRRQVDVL
jgi:hypothetical protein